MLTASRLSVPTDVREIVRRALAAQPQEVPDVAYRLASGWVMPEDREVIALWCLDNQDQFRTKQSTLAASLRGGVPGMRWAMLAAATGVVDPAVIEAQLAETVRSDQMLVPQVATAIMVAWDRMLDHSARKARSRLRRSAEWRRIELGSWPNPQVARLVGLDDLLDGTWDAFVGTLTAIFNQYARTQAAVVAVADASAAEAVRQAISARIVDIVNTLTSFLDIRARQFLSGETPFEPQDFAAARTITAWLSGAGGSPEGFGFDQLNVSRPEIGLSTAQTALLGLLASRLTRTFTWVHGFFGQPITPFVPHEELDRQSFTEAELVRLPVFINDHPGCHCALIPSWSLA